MFRQARNICCCEIACYNSNNFGPLSMMLTDWFSAQLTLNMETEKQIKSFYYSIDGCQTCKKQQQKTNASKRHLIGLYKTYLYTDARLDTIT